MTFHMRKGEETRCCWLLALWTGVQQHVGCVSERGGRGQRGWRCVEVCSCVRCVDVCLGWRGYG